MKKLNLILLLIFTFNYLFAQNSKPAPGMIRIGIPDGYFDFPKEICGAIVSFSGNKMNIDSVLYITYKLGSREIEKIDKLEYSNFKKEYSDLSKRIRINFPENLIKVLKKYETYKIQKTFKTFAPEDTLEHPIIRRGKQVYIKNPNFNRYITIYFNKKFNPEEVAKDLKKLPCIQFATPDYPLKFF